MVNFVAEFDFGSRELPPTDWNRKVDKSIPMEHFKDWKFPWLNIPEVIMTSDAIYEFPVSLLDSCRKDDAASDLLANQMVDRDPVPHWTFGHITLLGDAAHPMYPRGSNGASQAILDAATLSTCLSKQRNAAAGGDWIGRALTSYEELRIPPCSAIVLSNRKLGPEEVLQIVEERAPDGFDKLDDVVSKEELAAIVDAYSKLAGFDKERLDRRKEELEAIGDEMAR